MNRHILTYAMLLAGALLLQGCFSLFSSEPGCNNTCSFAFDGACDDGGPGASFDLCDYGTDCGDCGSRGDVVSCTDTCSFAFDGACDDGGPGASFDLCDYGTDCSDSGSRLD